MKYEMNVLGERVTVANKVAAALVEQYQERFPDDKPYVLGKAADLRELDMASCLMEWFNLDREGRIALSRRLKMPEDDLRKTCEGIQWICNQ